MIDRYNLTNFIEAVGNPYKFVEEIIRITERSQTPFHRTIGKEWFYLKHGKETNIMEKDWDNLIILDACRYDIFAETISDRGSPEGDLSSIVSMGSHSEEFVNAVFTEESFHDTVYVTANAFGAQVNDNVFHDMIVVFDDYNNMSVQKYDPEVVLEAAEDAYQRYSNKRLIFHFMQPHRPYLGEKAESLRSQLRKKGVAFEQWDNIDQTHRENAQVIGDLASAAQQNLISFDELRHIYKENLEYVLEYIENLINHIDGKTVITSDHGELLGEAPNPYVRKRATHFRNIYAQELREVPWFVTKSSERRNIQSSKPVKQENVDDDKIEEQLRALGYRN